MRKTRGFLIVAVMSAGAAITAPSVAQAATPSRDPLVLRQVAVDRQLRNFPGGVQVSPNQVDYDGGKVSVVFTNVVLDRRAVAAAAKARVGGTAAVPATVGTGACPGGAFATDYVCLYENENFNQNLDGRMLKFADNYFQSLNTYGFNDATSSWVNNRAHASYLWQNDTSSNAGTQFSMPARTKAAAMPTGLNDWASAVQPR